MSVADLEPISYSPVSLRRGGGRWRRVRLSLIARWRAGELDRQLAAGASPADSTLLAVRAERLTSRRFRERVAAGLTRAVRDAGACGFSAAVRPHRHEVMAARTVLAALDRRLRGAEPVTAQGVALLEALLTDGTSALYLPTEPGALGSRLRAAAAALEPLGRDDPARAGHETVR
jgi:hypothetical protein